jgi:hypothetical protein
MKNYVMLVRQSCGYGDSMSNVAIFNGYKLNHETEMIAQIICDAAWCAIYMPKSGYNYANRHMQASAGCNCSQR